MRFTDEYIEEVRDKNDIVDVISAYVRLEHRGSSYKGLCPFHSEKTPSFFVNRSRQMYHCFGCGKSGDVFNFLMEYDRSTFTESVVTLAGRAGMAVPEDTGTGYDREQKNRRDRLLEIHKEAAVWYFKALYQPGAKQALAYLRGRGLDDATIRKFGLGYSEKSGGALYRYLKDKGYTDADLKETGIFYIDEKKGTARDRFWNRVMFPIMDPARRVIGFGGRVMGSAEPKYLNSPETKIFDKSRNLYGLHLAKSTREKQMLICEGYMDVIALHAAGFDNAVASLGTALTSQQASLIHRYVKQALLLYDSDGAGIKAARRAIPLLKDAGIVPKVVDLSPYKDPDEFIKGLGAGALRQRLEQAENGFLFEVRQMEKEYDRSDPQGTADFANAVVGLLMGFSDEIERSSYTRSVSREFSLNRDLLERQIAKKALNGRPVKKEPEKLPDRSKKEPPDIKTEQLMLSWMGREEETARLASRYITENDFTTPLHREIFRALQDMLNAGWFNPVSILNRFEDLEERSAAAEILENFRIPDDPEQKDRGIKEVLAALKTRTYNRALQKAQENDPKELQMMLEEKIRLEKLKQEILNGIGEN